MNFETYLNQAWNDHAKNPQKVAAEFSIGEELVQSNDDLAKLVNLVTHVMAEHLDQCADGQVWLSKLRAHRAFQSGSETERAIERSVLVMKLGTNEITAANIETLAPSEQIRILAVAASAFSERNTAQSQQWLNKAIELARTGLEKNDPANRALAVTGNNLASSLEEKKPRTSDETELMILAAKTGREYWKVAGTWLQVSRAEYRLAMTYLQAASLEQAENHAQVCLDMCFANSADNLDMFYAYEAVAKVQKVRGQSAQFETALANAKKHFEKLSTDDQEWCKTSLSSLEA